MTAPDERRALLLVNPASSRAEVDLRPALAALENGGWRVDLVHTRDRADARRRIRDAPGSCTALLVGGGDGTLSGVLRELLDSGLPLGIVPLGTANDLARALGIPMDPREACALVALGRRRAIDVGMVGERPFLNVVSLGLAVEVTRALEEAPKGLLGRLSYPFSAARSLRGARPFRARVRCGDEEVELRSLQIAVANGRHYGGGMTALDDASLADQRLVVWSIEPQPAWRLVMDLPRYRLGKLRGLPTARVLTGTCIHVQTEVPMPLDVDGEIDGETPVEIRVLPRALTVFAPDPA